MAAAVSQWDELMKNSMARNLPNEIVIEILSRLPVKSIFRLKCACKPWHTLFGNSKFINIHLNQSISNSNDCLLLRHISDQEEENHFLQGNESWGFERLTLSAGCTSDFIMEESSKGFLYLGRVGEAEEIYSLLRKETFEEFGKIEVPVRSKTNYYAVVDSCNGLICLADSDSKGYHPSVNISLWNPAIREFKALPRCFINRFRVVGVGFTFLPMVNDYKVVRIVHFVDTKAFDIEVYSLNTDCWTKIDANLQCIFIDHLSQAFVNFAFHWMVYKKDEMGERHYFIQSFNVAENKFNEMMLPDFDCNENQFLLQKSPAILGDFLSLLIHNSFESCEIWVMKEYGVAKSWTKQYSLRQEVELMVPIGFSDNGHIIMEKTDGGELVLCEPNDESRRDLQVFGPARIVKYIESLVPLSG